MTLGARKLLGLVGVAMGLSAAAVYAEPSRGRGPASELSLSSKRARAALVTVERDGHPIALGFVLGDDGRVLTARSPLGDRGEVAVRYADGSRAPARLEHSDSAWDLALLTPRALRRVEGLAASEAPVRPEARLAAFSFASERLRAVPVLLRKRASYLGQRPRDLEPYEVLGGMGMGDLGTPVLDHSGTVVAMVTRGCLPVDERGRASCLPVPVGAPVPVLRQFLRTAPALEPPSPWLGAKVVADVTPYARGVRIRAVQAASPADQARLRGGPDDQGDLVVAIDGVPVPTPEALAEAIRRRKVDDLVFLLVLTDGQFREVPVVLKAAPRPSAGD